MLLSRKFVKDYLDLDDKLSIEQIANDMTNVGNEYDYCGKLINATNLIVGEVLECNDIPETHLHSCKVNVGDKVLDIVCGAPNVRSGLKVIVALPGAILPGGEIKETTIRGYKSCGMLCSIAELGLDNKFLETRDKEGIHEFPKDIEVGSDPIKALGLDDEVIDFELTSNRGDLLSIIGMSYELGAIYKKNVKDIDLSYKEIKDDEYTETIESQSYEKKLEQEAGQMQLLESPPAQTQQGLTADQQEAYDSLINRSVSPQKADELAKKYELKRIKSNMEMAVKQKETSRNLPGLIISLIEQDAVGKMEFEKQEARERIEQRQLDRRQAYDDFHGTQLSKIGKHEGTKEDKKEEKAIEELTDLEVEMIIKDGENAGIFLKRMKKLGLNIDDVKAGRRK